MDELVCPACGEDTDLTGERDGDAIVIACGSCANRWSRVPGHPKCPTCGREDTHEISVAVVERSRGSQLSILSTTPRWLCPECDAALLAEQRQTRSPLMPERIPTHDDPGGSGRR